MVDPDAPCKENWLLPAVRWVAFTVTNTVAGYDCTEAGFTLQEPMPDNREHDNKTLPANPFMEVTVMGPLVVELPAFTIGKGN